MEKKYTKTLVGRYSEPNRCFVADDVEVYVIPNGSLPVKDRTHHFISSENDKATAPYAWVKENDVPFSLQDFLTRNHLEPKSDNELEHIRIMLDSIQNLDKGTPVAPSYVSRGLFEKKVVLTVHKVILY